MGRVMDYRVLYSQTSRLQIKALHPRARSIIKAQIENLKENPYLGKSLEKELSGYHSLRTKRFRIIYKIDNSAHIIQIHYVGHRRDIYDLFKETLTRA
jgi:mRNA interferase RelE/StbE